MEYEAVIGLEVHVQIKTESKIFSGSRAGYGYEPNELVDPVVLGLPGALPVMNKAALDGIIKAGLAFKCSITEWCKGIGKTISIPIAPTIIRSPNTISPYAKVYEVEIELSGDSRAEIGEHKNIKLTRIHLENDVGKLNHFAEDSLVDYNRASTLLMEIVSEPDMYWDEAFAFLTSIRQTDDLLWRFRLRHGEGSDASGRKYIRSTGGRNDLGLPRSNSRISIV